MLFRSQILLRRSGTPEGKYIHGIGSSFDQDLFLIIWGPTVAALSYVYDNGLEKSVVQKAIVGFRYSTIILFQGTKLTFLARSHLAPKFSKVVAKAKKLGWISSF